MLTDHARTNLGCCRDPIGMRKSERSDLRARQFRVRTVALLAGALLLGGCDTLSSLNPFDKTERYKLEIVPEVPAGQLYNDGLARMKKRTTRAPPRSSASSRSSIRIRIGRAKRCS